MDVVAGQHLRPACGMMLVFGSHIDTLGDHHDIFDSC